jgi:hypothetical protein
MSEKEYFVFEVTAEINPEQSTRSRWIFQTFGEHNTNAVMLMLLLLKDHHM